MPSRHPGIRMRCKDCDNRLYLNPELQGKKIRCPECGADEDSFESLGRDADLRNDNLSYESRIKYVGIFFYCNVLIIFLVASAFSSSFIESNAPIINWVLTWTASLLLALGCIVLGFGIRSLKLWTRKYIRIFCFIAWIGFPLGKLLRHSIRDLILSEKGSFIFSEEYKAIIAATPEIKSSSFLSEIPSWLFWMIVLTLLMAIPFYVMIAFSEDAGR